MRLLVLGATGRLGALVVEEAITRGHQVTVLARSPEKLGDRVAAVKVVSGDALDADAVGSAVAGQDVVVYALGAGNVRRTTLFSDSTRILLDQMQHDGVRRLLCVTGVGAGETKGHGGFWYDRVLYPLFTKGVYADKDRQEALIRTEQHGLDDCSAGTVPEAHTRRASSGRHPSRSHRPSKNRAARSRPLCPRRG